MENFWLSNVLVQNEFKDNKNSKVIQHYTIKHKKYLTKKCFVT